MENSVIIPCTDAISVRLTPNPQLELHYLDFICSKEGTRLPRPGFRVYETGRGYRATRPLKTMCAADKDGPIQLYLVQTSLWVGFQICAADGQIIKEIGVSITVEPKEPGPDGPARPWRGKLW
ncbi:hypothetical protein CTheo_3974 [Ceratobasidium theobromae]|uniref:Uncharacterized protein n=1 Tax=Ceratobasidium theobromae TaxID=1582974 RepID=A0A5N5QLN3_9AGAM|nr:hypothetical protein CTheo_3974 [Ceratobasidium theobromae]